MDWLSLKKIELTNQLSNHNKSINNNGVNVNNKEIISNRLMHNAILSSFLKSLSKDSKESKYAKLGHHMEKVLIDYLFEDAQNNIDTGYAIEAVHNVGVAMMKISIENKTTTDVLVGIKNKKI